MALITNDERVLAVAAKKGNDLCAVIVNPTEEEIPLNIELGAPVTRCLLTADGENEKEIPLPAVLPPECILTVFAEIT